MSLKNRLLPFLLVMLAATPVFADEPASRGPAPAARESPAAAGAVVDLNNASQAELEALPGIGPSKAQAIIRHRESRRFERVEDLLRVRGIGRATFQQLRPLVTVGSAPARSRR